MLENILSDKWLLFSQAFLKSEVSAENILFWQACEKFQKIPPTNLDEVGRLSSCMYESLITDLNSYIVFHGPSGYFLRSVLLISKHANHTEHSSRWFIGDLS